MTLALLGAPWLQLFDILGAPAAGFTLYTYEAGTDTPLLTYSDSDGETPNPTGIELDVAGHAEVYCLTSIGYKFVLRDADGAEVWTQDNVMVDPGAFLVSELISTAGSRNVDTGYNVLPTDHLITVDGSDTPSGIIMPAASERDLPITIMNVGAEPVSIVLNGDDTINGVLTVLEVSAAASPVFPTLTLTPGKTLGSEDANNTWWLTSTAAVSGGTLT